MIDAEWTKNFSKSINIRKLISWFNKFSGYVSCLIVSHTNVKKRAKYIEKSILLASEFQKLKNYNAIFEVMSGLTNSSVSRLKKSWKLVSNNLMEKFENLLLFLDSHQNFQTLRTAQSNKKKDVVVLPYLGIFLTDLIFIEEGNKNFVDGKINFEKRRKISKVIQNLSIYQEDNYYFRTYPDLFNRLEKFENLPEKKIYSLSLENEPKDL
jgi:hypothetical protein